MLIVDGHPIHKSKKVIDCIESLYGFLERVFLPPYAPDLNSDACLASYEKYWY